MVAKRTKIPVLMANGPIESEHIETQAFSVVTQLCMRVLDSCAKSVRSKARPLPAAHMRLCPRQQIRATMGCPETTAFVNAFGVVLERRKRQQLFYVRLTVAVLHGTLYRT